MAGEGFYRATITSLLYGQQFKNVLQFLGPSADQGALQVLCNEVNTIWVARWRAIQSETLTYVNIRAEALGTALAPRELTISVKGSSSQSNELDPCTAYVLRLRTDFAGKHGRGRIYLGGVFINQFQFGIASQNIATSVQSISEQVLGNTGFGSSIFTLCVGNKTGGLVFHPVVSIQIAPTIGHQRRRNVGVGI